MIRTKKRFRLFFSLFALLLMTAAVLPARAEENRTVRLVFTSDIHSYLDAAEEMGADGPREHGGGARLATLLKEQAAKEDILYVDGGDFSQGTLFQALYESDAAELALLSELGCAAVTAGNHEWDHGGFGFAAMLNARCESGETLTPVLCSNLDFSGELTEEQKAVNEALTRYNELAHSTGGWRYTVVTVDGIRFGIIGVSGPNSIEDSPTSGMKWLNYIDAAKEVSAELKDKCDVIICLSHSGANGSGTAGDDIELANAVPDIDFILSGHAHNAYASAVTAGGVTIGAPGCYLQNLGAVTLSLSDDGTVSFSDYALLPIDASVADDPDIKAVIENDKKRIEEEYLAQYGYSYDELLAHCGFNFITLNEMYATHDEYPMGDLIADSYLYEAGLHGIEDIDVALVGLGTIRGSFYKKDIRVPDAFGICSLGAGADGSAGHPILGAYITGKELKLLVELDASLGPMVSSIKMSYSGLKYTFNTKRMLLDRVTEVYLEKDGERIEIENDKLYKVSCNMYAANMLGMLNGLTKGILSITPKYADGTPIEDFYSCSLLTEEGTEIKEWVAFADYLASFEEGDSGLPEIPGVYAGKQGRKVKTAEGGLAVIAHPGLSTILAAVIAVLALLLLWLLYKLIRRIVRKIRKKKTAKE